MATATERLYFDEDNALWERMDDNHVVYWGNVVTLDLNNDDGGGYYLGIIFWTEAAVTSEMWMELHDTEAAVKERMLRALARHLDFEDGVNAGIHGEDEED